MNRAKPGQMLRDIVFSVWTPQEAGYGGGFPFNVTGPMTPNFREMADCPLAMSWRVKQFSVRVFNLPVILDWLFCIEISKVIPR